MTNTNLTRIRDSIRESVDAVLKGKKGTPENIWRQICDLIPAQVAPIKENLRLAATSSQASSQPTLAAGTRALFASRSVNTLGVDSSVNTLGVHNGSQTARVFRPSENSAASSRATSPQPQQENVVPQTARLSTAARAQGTFEKGTAKITKNDVDNIIQPVSKCLGKPLELTKIIEMPQQNFKQYLKREVEAYATSFFPWSEGRHASNASLLIYILAVREAQDAILREHAEGRSRAQSEATAAEAELRRAAQQQAEQFEAGKRNLVSVEAQTRAGVVETEETAQKIIDIQAETLQNQLKIFLNDAKLKSILAQQAKKEQEDLAKAEEAAKVAEFMKKHTEMFEAESSKRTTLTNEHESITGKILAEFIETAENIVITNIQQTERAAELLHLQTSEELQRAKDLAAEQDAFRTIAQNGRDSGMVIAREQWAAQEESAHQIETQALLQRFNDGLSVLRQQFLTPIFEEKLSGMTTSESLERERLQSQYSADTQALRALAKEGEESARSRELAGEAVKREAALQMKISKLIADEFEARTIVSSESSDVMSDLKVTFKERIADARAAAAERAAAEERRRAEEARLQAARQAELALAEARLQAERAAAEARLREEELQRAAAEAKREAEEARRIISANDLSGDSIETPRPGSAVDLDSLSEIGARSAGRASAAPSFNGSSVSFANMTSVSQTTSVNGRRRRAGVAPGFE